MLFDVVQRRVQSDVTELN